MWESLLKPDLHWKKVYKMHLKARTHSYVNSAWMVFCVGVFVYFANIKYNVEIDVKCIAVRDIEDSSKFVRYASVEDAL